LAEQHLNAKDASLSDLPASPSWPEPFAYAAERLPRVVDDAALIARALKLYRRYEDDERAVVARVLVHGDFGFHSLVVEEALGAVIGVFDYDGAAFADRHHDFKYLVLDVEDETLLESAIDAYTRAGGAPIDRERLYLINAASAVCFLAYRAGAGADEKPAG